MADLIDRQALLKTLMPYVQNRSSDILHAIDAIVAAPAVDAVEVPTDNTDNLDLAVKALGIFRLSYCLNAKETEKANNLVFRCSDCPFENHRTRKCSIKIFLNEFATDEQRERFSPIV